MRLESTSSRVASSGARRSISASKVRLESSIIAHSSPSNVALDEPRLVAQLLEPQRVGEPPRGVDRHHGDLQPALGHAHRDRRGRGGLAHAPGAGADHDPAPFEDVEHAGRLDESFAHREGDRLRTAARVELGDHVVQSPPGPLSPPSPSPSGSGSWPAAGRRPTAAPPGEPAAAFDLPTAAITADVESGSLPALKPEPTPEPEEPEPSTAAAGPSTSTAAPAPAPAAPAPAPEPEPGPVTGGGED